MQASDPSMRLPTDLPVPVDDGACRHLPGASLPRLSLRSTRDREISLRDESIRRPVVLFVYPRTATPDRPPTAAWDRIPGARGCTVQACSFRDTHAEFEALKVRVFGLSVQSTAYQKEMAERLRLPFEILSDDEQRLQQALRLPTFEFEGETLLKRVTLFLRNGRIRHVFYPVFPPNESAAQVVAWLRAENARP